MSKNITLWKGDTFKKVNRQEVIDRIIKYSKTDIEFSKLLKVIIGKIEFFETVLVYNDGTIRIFYEKGIYSYHRPPSDFIKGQDALLLEKMLFTDEEKKMQRKNGFFVLLGNNEDIKFEGIIVYMHDSLDDTIQVKRGFYDNYNGKYVQKDVLIVDYLKGTGMEKFKQFITKVATDRLKCGFQMPEMAITKDAMDFIEK
mgnify:FL=1